jgi:hypothetical protein
LIPGTEPKTGALVVAGFTESPGATAPPVTLFNSGAGIGFTLVTGFISICPFFLKLRRAWVVEMKKLHWNHAANYRTTLTREPFSMAQFGCFFFV